VRERSKIVARGLLIRNARTGEKWRAGESHRLNMKRSVENPGIDKV